MYPGLNYRGAGFGSGNLTFENVVFWGSHAEAVFHLLGGRISGAARDYAFPMQPELGGTITGFTAADPSVVTVGAGHGVVVGDYVNITGCVDSVGAGASCTLNNEADNPRWEVTAVAATTITVDLDAACGTFVTGGTWSKVTPTAHLRAGLLMGYHTANKLWLPWTGGRASPPSDGTQTIRGILAETIDMQIAGANQARDVPLQVTGKIRASKIAIPGFKDLGIDGHALESTIRTQLAPQHYLLDDYYQQ